MLLHLAEPVDLTHSGEAVHANILIISWFFYFIMAVPSWACAFNEVFCSFFFLSFFSERQEEKLLSFSLLFVLLIPITMGPVQTIIFKGHLFCSISS